jgi:hypothetical protein
MREILAKKRAQERELARIEKGKRDGEKFVNTSMLLTLAYAAAGLTPTDLFHIYHDRDFFAYQVDISRDDEASGDLGQRYTLCVSLKASNHAEAY